MEIIKNTIKELHRENTAIKNEVVDILNLFLEFERITDEIIERQDRQIQALENKLKRGK